VITPIALYFKKDVPDLPVAELTKRFEVMVKALDATPSSSTPGAETPPAEPPD
jgi:hypothetical protein